MARGVTHDYEKQIRWEAVTHELEWEQDKGARGMRDREVRLESKRRERDREVWGMSESEGELGV